MFYFFGLLLQRVNRILTIRQKIYLPDECVIRYTKICWTIKEENMETIMLHNAGNDGAYPLEAILSIARKDHERQ